MTPDLAYQIANTVALIGWLVLLASPWRPELAQRVSGVAIPLLLAIAYAGFFMAYWGMGEGGFDSLEAVTKLFRVPELVLVGWVHYLAFDLFIGAWEVRVARREGMPFYMVVPCLFLTFLAGPVGLLLFFTLRTARNFNASRQPSGIE